MARSDNLAHKLNYRLPRFRLCLVQEGDAGSRPVTICRPEDAADLLKPLSHASEEHFVSLHLNAKHEVIGLHEVSHGTLSASLVHPREVFKAALVANSFAIIVCHNHPSGSLITPSQEDIDTTTQLIAAGKLLGVNVVDHLIIGPSRRKGNLYSFREHLPKLWNEAVPSP